jgi:hypothetical protein
LRVSSLRGHFTWKPFGQWVGGFFSCALPPFAA